MRRIGLWSLGVVVLAGCNDDGATSSPSAGTVAIGQLPGTLPQPTTTSTAPATTVTTTSAPDTSTVLADELVGMLDGAPAPSPPMALVEDDTGRLRVEVPVEWDDRRTDPVLAAGTDAPSIAASTLLIAFLDGYEQPGITVVVVTEPPATALRDFQFDEDCARLQQGRYVNDRLEGEYRSWRGCGGTGTGIVAVAADAGDETVLVLAQVLGPADLAAVDATLASVDVSR